MGSFFNDVIHCKLCCYEFDKTKFPVLHLGWYSALANTYPQVIQAHEPSSTVIMENCIRCHTELNTEFVKTGRITYMMAQVGQGKACWDCHRNVTHGGQNAITSTPNAIVPYPASPTPKWLRDMMGSSN